MSTINESNARRFAERLKERLGSNLHAVLLYGSVARGDARTDSDTDLLVVTGIPVPKVRPPDLGEFRMSRF